MPEKINFRCPECDTYSGIFTPSAEGYLIHSTCGREGTIASFIRGTQEYEDAYEEDAYEDEESEGESDQERRVRLAGIAIDAFVRATGLEYEAEDQGTILGDLVANLAHWADAQEGLVWEDIRDLADRHHAAEQEEADLARLRRLQEGG